MSASSGLPLPGACARRQRRGSAGASRSPQTCGTCAPGARSDILAFLGIAAAVAVAECFPIELSYSNEKVTYSLSDAVWTGALLLSPSSVLILAAAAGVLVGQSVQSWAPHKVAFNVGQFTIGIAAAVAVVRRARFAARERAASWAAAAIAMAAFQAVNTVLMGAIIALTEHQPFWKVALVPTGVVHWIGNLSLGILGALIWYTEPVAIPLLLVPTVLTYLAYRGWLTTVQERDQMGEMAAAADSISESGDLERRVPELGNRTAAGTLGRTLNGMLERLEASFRARAAVPSTDLPRVANAHHDLPRSPRGARSRSRSRRAGRHRQPRDRRAGPDAATRRGHDDARRDGGPGGTARRGRQVERLVADVTTKAAALLDGRLRAEAPDAGVMRADAQRMTQALINLLQNAAEHTTAGTPIHFRTTATNAGLAIRGRRPGWRTTARHRGRTCSSRSSRPSHRSAAASGCASSPGSPAPTAASPGSTTGLGRAPRSGWRSRDERAARRGRRPHRHVRPERPELRWVRRRLGGRPVPKHSSGPASSTSDARTPCILDLGLPDLDGLDVLAALRSSGCRTRVVIITARSEAIDRARAVALGIDDYFTKPFSMAELVASLRSD